MVPPAFSGLLSSTREPCLLTDSKIEKNVENTPVHYQVVRTHSFKTVHFHCISKPKRRMCTAQN